MTPPTSGRPWSQYELTVCVKGASPASCLSSVPLCAANSDNSPSTCAIPGCDAQVTYTVVAVAIKDSGATRSPGSNAAEFTTPQHS